MGVTIADRKWLLGARKMRQDDDEDFDDAESMVSIETGRTNLSDDAEFYDTYTKSDGEDAAVDEAIEELTEKRYLSIVCEPGMRLCVRRCLRIYACGLLMVSMH